MATITVIYHDLRASSETNPDGQLVAFYVVADDEPVPWANIKADLETIRGRLKEKT